VRLRPGPGRSSPAITRGGLKPHDQTNNHLPARGESRRGSRWNNPLHRLAEPRPLRRHAEEDAGQATARTHPEHVFKV
jgi:hypothetical protein